MKELDWVPDRFAENLTEQEAVPKALVEYCLLMSYYSLSDSRHSLELSRLILSHIDDDIKQANNRNSNILSQVKEAVEQVQALLSPREPIRSQRTYGRNDRVKVRYIQSGKEEYKKYKQVKDDLSNGYCVII